MVMLSVHPSILILTILQHDYTQKWAICVGAMQLTYSTAFEYEYTTFYSIPLGNLTYSYRKLPFIYG